MMKKRMLTSYIENQKFLMNNNLSNNKQPFNKMTDRFKYKYNEEITGTRLIHSRKGLQPSLSMGDLTSKTGIKHVVLHKNKSQPIFDLKNKQTLDVEKRPQKRIYSGRSNGSAEGSIYNLLMKTPEKEKAARNIKISNKKFESNNIFTPETYVPKPKLKLYEEQNKILKGSCKLSNVFQK